MAQTDSLDLRIIENAERAAAECAEFILATLVEVRSTQGRASLAISGGSSPKAMFADMAQAAFDWTNIHFFWVDERCVPPTDKESNYKMAHDALLGPAHIDPDNIHRIYGEIPPPEAAAKYVEDISTYFHLPPGELPSFDILHRGMGPDAHTASLFPGSPLVDDRQNIATDVWVEKFKMYRVTLLPGVLERAKRTVLQVVGADKAEALQKVLHGPRDVKQYPCQIASRGPHVSWFLDRAAASKL